MNIESTIAGVVAIVVAFLTPIALCVLSVKKPPTWLKDGPLHNNWLRINVFATLAATFSAIVAGLLYGEFNLYIRGTAMLMCSLLAFCVAQTFFTDFWQRYADRRVLRTANIIAGVFGTYFILNVFGLPTLAVYAILFLAATVIIYIPQIGASDGRALQLAVLTSVPLVGILGFQYGIIGFLFCLMLFGIGNALYKKDVKSLVKKVSMPLVPLILLPFLLIIQSHMLFSF